MKVPKCDRLIYYAVLSQSLLEACYFTVFCIVNYILYAKQLLFKETSIMCNCKQDIVLLVVQFTYTNYCNIYLSYITIISIEQVACVAGGISRGSEN
jgi:hypothetical protein